VVFVTPKKAQGSGTLRERPKGSGNWQWQIRVGKDSVSGKDVRISRTFKAKNRAAAEKVVRQMLHEIEAKPVRVDGSTMTMAELFDEWLLQLQSKGRSPHTIYTSKRIIKTVLNPVFGDCEIRNMSARTLDQWYSSLRTQSRPLSAATVRRYHAIISSALAQAVRWDWIKSNPAAKSNPPMIERKPLKIPTMDEIQAIAEKMSELHPAYGVAVILATATGMRRGEVCGLKWSDMEGDAIVVRHSVVRLEKETVVKSTKTGKERLIMPAPQVLDLLSWWRQNREEVARSLDVDVDPDGFVLSQRPDQSEPQNPDSLTATFSKAAAACGLGHVHFHSLRHYAATELLAGGVDVRNTASMLGHSNPRLTLETYAHATNERQRMAGEVLGRAVPTLSIGRSTNRKTPGPKARGSSTTAPVAGLPTA
jgi:integrase